MVTDADDDHPARVQMYTQHGGFDGGDDIISLPAQGIMSLSFVAAAADAANAAAARCAAAAAFCRSSAFPVSMHLNLITSLLFKYRITDIQISVICLNSMIVFTGVNIGNPIFEYR